MNEAGSPCSAPVKTKSRSRVAEGVFYATMVLTSVVLGGVLAWFAIRYGTVDPKVAGPLFLPLAITYSFVFLGLGVGIFHYRGILSWLDRYLPPDEKGLRALVIIVAVAAGYETLRLCLFDFLGYYPTDLPSYHYASRALLLRIDPYIDRNLEELAGGMHVFPYVYPPFLALLWMPLAKLPIEQVAAVWQVISLAALIGSLILSIRLARPYTSDARAAALVVALLLPLGLPAYVNFHHGAVSAVFTFLIVLFFERLARGKDRTAGIVLAIACGIKVLPVILLLYLAIKKRWRALGVTLAVGAALVLVSVLVLGWKVHWRFIVAPQLGYSVHSNLGYDAVFHPENQSINGFMSRVVCGHTAGCSMMIALLCLMTAVAVGWFAGKRREIDGVEAAAVILAVLLISPITWFHHLLLVMVPAVVLAARVTEGSWRPRWWPLTALAVGALLAHDFGRPIMAIRGFVPLANIRFGMLVFLYVTFLLILHDIRRDKQLRLPGA